MRSGGFCNPQNRRWEYACFECPWVSLRCLINVQRIWLPISLPSRIRGLRSKAFARLTFNLERIIAMSMRLLFRHKVCCFLGTERVDDSQAKNKQLGMYANLSTGGFLDNGSASNILCFPQVGAPDRLLSLPSSANTDERLHARRRRHSQSWLRDAWS